MHVCTLTKTGCLLFLALMIMPAVPLNAFGEHVEDWQLTSGYWSIQFENDYFTFSGDGHYTNGTEISRLVSNPGPAWLEGLGRWLPFFYLDEDQSAINYSVGQKIFTPEDLDQTALISDDRPYAGYLYLSAELVSRISRSDSLDTGNVLEITLGVVGPASGASGVQEYFHKVFGSDEPMGWDNQLKNELGLLVSYSRIWNIIQPGPGVLEIGISPHLTGTLGNIYTHAAGGVMFRLGNNLRASFTPPNIRPGFPGISYFNPSPRFNWYLFFGHESRIVFRDIFLDGNTFADSHNVEKELLVGDHQFGLALHKNNFRIALSNMLRTKEFASQDTLTQYGALNLSFTF